MKRIRKVHRLAAAGARCTAAAGCARKRRQDSNSEMEYASYASMTVGGSRERACPGMQRNASLRFVPVSDAFSFMNVLRSDTCARRSKQKVQFSEALMFRRYQCEEAEKAVCVARGVENQCDDDSSQRRVASQGRPACTRRRIKSSENRVPHLLTSAMPQPSTVRSPRAANWTSARWPADAARHSSIRPLRTSSLTASSRTRNPSVDPRTLNKQGSPVRRQAQHCLRKL